MKGRCYNPKNRSYKHYGGRGIKICDEWLNNFNAFYDWSMANGFSNQKSPKGRRFLSIDRIDVNGNYEPSNCRWTTNEIQGQNTTKNKHYTYNGETHLIKEWANIFNIKEETLYYRLNHWDIEDAFTRKLIIKKRKKEN